MTTTRKTVVAVAVVVVLALAAWLGVGKALAHKEKHTPDQPAWP
jgi:hypothetical protein